MNGKQYLLEFTYLPESDTLYIRKDKARRLEAAPQTLCLPACSFFPGEDSQKVSHVI